MGKQCVRELIKSEVVKKQVEKALEDVIGSASRSISGKVVDVHKQKRKRT